VELLADVVDACLTPELFVPVKAKLVLNAFVEIILDDGLVLGPDVDVVFPAGVLVGMALWLVLNVEDGVVDTRDTLQDAPPQSEYKT